MRSMLDTTAAPSPQAEEAMQRFDDSRWAVLRRARREGMLALGTSVALTVAAWPLSKPAATNALGGAGATVMSMLLSTGLVLAWVSVIRIFQSALYPMEEKTFAPILDHFAIMWATGYVVWLLYSLGAAWR
ncbi:MAG: hypothetical protein HY291_17550 [Planctomycetes bacterium]|nr:hypothetical protein [Planctomycetota bacterium]